MSEIYRVVDDSGKLIGFKLNGRLIELPEMKTESMALRSLANELMNELLELPAIKPTEFYESIGPFYRQVRDRD